MRSIKRWGPMCLVVGLILASASTLGADSGAEDTNVLVTIVKGRMQGDDKVPVKTYRLIAVAGGDKVRFMAGSRVPIPVTEFQASTPPNREIVPMTSYTYQHVGFSAEVRVWIGPEQQITLEAEIEDSRIDPDGRLEAQPTIETQHQEIKAMLTDAQPLQIIRMDDPAEGTLYFEVEARIMG